MPSRPIAVTPVPNPAQRRPTRSGLSIPAPGLPVPQYAPRTDSFEVPFTGSPAGGGSKAKTFTILAILALLLIGGGAGAYFWSINRAGKVEITAVPADATILVDNVKVADHAPFTLEKPPGPYTVSVMRPGYTRNDQSVEIRAGQLANLQVVLEAAADTGFELTSDPPGGLVWLDGNAMSGPDGQARTDFRAYRIPPGKHVLEIKGDPKRHPWKEEILVEPGLIKKVKATLLPVGSEGGRAPSAPPAPTPAPGAPASPLAQGGEPHPGAPSAGVRRRPRPARPEAEDESSSSVPVPTPSRPSRSAPAGSDDTGGGDCSITVGTRPWSEIWIDGKNTGRHTPYSESIPCGKHKLTFKRPDLNLQRTENITVRSGEKFKQSFSLEPDSE
jgi:hypothetical protein